MVTLVKHLLLVYSKAVVICELSGNSRQRMGTTFKGLFTTRGC